MSLKPCIVSKSQDQIRLCIDMREVSKAVTRMCHPITTVHDLLVKLQGSKVFTELDIIYDFCFSSIGT